MPDFSFEQAARALGKQVICGIDEAGRGPLAGPVSVAAVILPPDFDGEGLNDSKKLSAKKRDSLYERITQDPLVQWTHVFADAEEIDRKNILRATRALEAKYSVQIDHCLIDVRRLK